MKLKRGKPIWIIKKCKFCGNEFQTAVHIHLYCNRKCFDSYRKSSIGRIERSNQKKLFYKNNPEVCELISKKIKELHKNPAGPYDSSWNVKRPKWQKGNKPWNTGLKYKRPAYSEWLKLNGHWKKGQSMEERFGIERANEIKANLAILCSNRKKYITNEEQQKKLDYYKKVWKLTNSQPLHTLENSNLRGAIHLNSKAYNLDHIIPIIFGYKNNIDPEIIADIKNLRFIPALQNHKKSYNDKHFNNLSDSE